MTGGEVEATLPPRRAPDGLPVVGTSARGPMRATDRREAELPFVGQSKNRITRGLGQRSLTRQTVLWRRERAGLRVELLDNTDTRTIEIDVRPAQRIQLPRPQARERRDLKPRRKRRARQLVRAANQLPNLLLIRRLLVTTTRTLGDPKPRKRVLPHEPPRLRRGGVVEHRTQRGHRAIALPTGEPLRDNLVTNPSDAQVPVTIDERPRALTIVDIRGLLRTGEQRIAGPALPERPRRHVLYACVSEPFACLHTRLLGPGLGGEGSRASEDVRDAEVLSRGRVIDLRPPAPGGKSGNAHAARLSVAHPIAADGLNRRVRRPQVTDGIPSATIRSTVATLTPMIRASSARET